MRKAVIDVGSNSVLLVVEEKTSQGWQPVFESTAVTALGEGTKATGVLGERGMTDTLAALRQMFAEAQERGAETVEAAATMAARIATNTPEFQARAEAQGTPVSVLSGEMEAELGFQAVANDPLFAEVNRLSIIDPGGHSTEIVTADRTDRGWNVGFRRSYPIGTLGMRSEMENGETLDSLALLRTCAKLDDAIGLGYRPGEAGRAVVLGATGTNLISIRERMTSWQPDRVHGARLDYEEVSKAAGWLCGMTDAERAQVVGMEPGRERTIHLGALILERFLYALRVHDCAVSVRGWRHALLEFGLPKA